MILYEPPKPATSIPVIDLTASYEGSAADRKALAREVHVACRETGFFYVSHHRVPRQLVTAQFAAARAFFDLPLEAKLALHMKNSPTTAGYEPIGGQILDSQDANAELAPSDLKESFYCGMDLPDDHPLAQPGMRGFGHNLWPAAHPEFRAQMVAYWPTMVGLANRILALIALSLDLPEDWFAPHFAQPVGTLRLIHYPPQPENALFNQIGAGAHTDWGVITLLAQDESGGLEVRNVAGEWISATPIPDTFVINLGDLMARWTNGVYRSNMHRVKNGKPANHRYSVPFFYNAWPETTIAPIPGTVAPDQPQLYPTCTAYEHMAEMFRRSYGYAPKESAA